MRSAEGRPSKASFDCCRFLIDDERPDFRPAGALLELPGQVALDGEADVTIRDCWFDARAEIAVNAVNCGTANLIGNDYGGTRAAVIYGVSDGKRARVRIDGGKFNRVGGSAVSVVAAGAADTGSALELAGTWNGVARPVAGDPEAIAAATVVSTRLMPMAALPAAGLVGDIVMLTEPRPGAPDGYRCTGSSASAAQWRLASQAGVSRGSRAERPQLGARDAGARYFDTGLAEAGKPVWWTGSAWVDATGNAV